MEGVSILNGCLFPPSWVNSGRLLLVIGILLLLAGIYIAASPEVAFNEGNQCGVGCRDVAGSISLVAPGALLAALGIILAVYGLRKKGDDD